MLDILHFMPSSIFNKMSGFHPFQSPAFFFLFSVRQLADGNFPGNSQIPKSSRLWMLHNVTHCDVRHNEVRQTMGTLNFKNNRNVTTSTF